MYYIPFNVSNSIAMLFSRYMIRGAVLRILHGDPNDTQFEPFLAHFEQLRQMYESIEKEESDV